MDTHDSSNRTHHHAGYKKTSHEQKYSGRSYAGAKPIEKILGDLPEPMPEDRIEKEEDITPSIFDLIKKNISKTQIILIVGLIFAVILESFMK